MIPLESGTSSVYVEYITLALMRAGFIKETSNTYDESTENAVISFQRANGLTADGIVGNNTYAALLPYLEGSRRVIASADDSLASLARKYEVSEGVIRIANPYTDWDNLQNEVIVIPFDFDIVPTDVSYTYYLVTLILRGLVARYPFIKSFSTGLSIMGKPIEGIVIGEGTTEVFFNATHHANEWITTPLVLKFAEEYAYAKAFDTNISDKSAKELYDKKTLYIVPVVNPDGLDLVTGGMTDTYYLDISQKISQAYPAIPYPAGWKANITGTDLNLNYPAGWLNARENKYAMGFVSPAPRDFVGTSPLSAPESRAIYA